jgi:hypothetical protein
MCSIAGIYSYHYAANPIDVCELCRIRDHIAEVLLHFYAAKGPAMVRGLRGMLPLNCGTPKRAVLLLAGHPYGIKPLYDPR